MQATEEGFSGQLKVSNSNQNKKVSSDLSSNGKTNYLQLLLTELEEKHNYLEKENSKLGRHLDDEKEKYGLLYSYSSKVEAELRVSREKERNLQTTVRELTIKVRELKEENMIMTQQGEELLDDYKTLQDAYLEVQELLKDLEDKLGDEKWKKLQKDIDNEILVTELSKMKELQARIEFENDGEEDENNRQLANKFKGPKYNTKNIEQLSLNNSVDNQTNLHIKKLGKEGSIRTDMFDDAPIIDDIDSNSSVSKISGKFYLKKRTTMRFKDMVKNQTSIIKKQSTNNNKPQKQLETIPDDEYAERYDSNILLAKNLKTDGSNKRTIASKIEQEEVVSLEDQSEELALDISDHLRECIGVSLGTQTTFMETSPLKKDVVVKKRFDRHHQEKERGGCCTQ